MLRTIIVVINVIAYVTCLELLKMKKMYFIVKLQPESSILYVIINSILRVHASQVPSRFLIHNPGVCLGHV